MKSFLKTNIFYRKFQYFGVIHKGKYRKALTFDPPPAQTFAQFRPKSFIDAQNANAIDFKVTLKDFIIHKKCVCIYIQMTH